MIRSAIRPWRFPPTADFQYGEWLRDEYEAGQIPQPEPMLDLALLITTVLTGDRSLAGPPPAQILSPVPRADVVRASVAGIPGLLEDLDGDTRNVVLTVGQCRGHRVDHIPRSGARLPRSGISWAMGTSSGDS